MDECKSLVAVGSGNSFRHPVEVIPRSRREAGAYTVHFSPQRYTLLWNMSSEYLESEWENS